jgi:hypothetical protein
MTEKCIEAQITVREDAPVNSIAGMLADILVYSVYRALKDRPDELIRRDRADEIGKVVCHAKLFLQQLPEAERNPAFWYPQEARKES